MSDLTKEEVFENFFSNGETFISTFKINSKEDIANLVLKHPDIATNYIWCGINQIRKLKEENN